MKPDKMVNLGPQLVISDHSLSLYIISWNTETFLIWVSHISSSIPLLIYYPHISIEIWRCWMTFPSGNKLLDWNIWPPIYFILFFNFLTALRGTWDLSSLTSNQTCAPCIGRWSLNQWTTREVPPSPFRHAVSSLGPTSGRSPTSAEPQVSLIQDGIWKRIK